MKNKKGMTMALEQLVKIVLAIAGVIMFLLLIYILVYGILFPKNTSEAQAKGTVEQINELLISLQKEQSDTLTITSPKGWTIIGFKIDSASIGGFEKPDSFIGKNAVCVCQKTCKREICRAINKPLQINSAEPFDYKIGEPKSFSVTDTGEYYEIKEITSLGGGGSSSAG